MHAKQQHPQHAWAWWAMLCLLWLGLMLQGQMELQRRVLGAAHVHAAPALATTHADQHTHHWHTARLHHHADAERHHHGHGDASVVTLESLHGTDGGPSDASLGSLLQPLGISASLIWCAAAGQSHGWPAAADPAWRDAVRRQPERPPSS